MTLEKQRRGQKICKTSSPNWFHVFLCSSLSSGLSSFVFPFLGRILFLSEGFPGHFDHWEHLIFLNGVRNSACAFIQMTASSNGTVSTSPLPLCLVHVALYSFSVELSFGASPIVFPIFLVFLFLCIFVYACSFLYILSQCPTGPCRV